MNDGYETLSFFFVNAIDYNAKTDEKYFFQSTVDCVIFYRMLTASKNFFLD